MARSASLTTGRSVADGGARRRGKRRPGRRSGSNATRPILHRLCDFLSKFVDSNDREIRRIQPLVDATNALEAEFEAMSDEEIRAAFAELRAEALEAAKPDEPSEDELHHPDLERRRELTQGAPAARERASPARAGRGPARSLRDDPRGDEADARDAPFRRPADRWRRPPPGQDRRDADRRGQDPRRAAGRHPQLARRSRRPRRHGQRLPRPPRPAVDGPDLPLPRRQRRDDHPRFLVRLRAGLPDQRRAAGQPAPGPARRGVRRRRDLRHQQRVRVRLPARQHGPGAQPAGPARAQLRDRRRGRQHPHRRGADAADHQRPGRGVGGPLLHLRPPRAAAQGATRGRGRGRRLRHRPQGQGRLLDRGGRREDGGLARRREHVRRRSAAGPPLRAGAPGPRPLQARPRLHRQGRRDRHRRRVHRSPDARPPLERGPPPGDRGQGGAARPARERDAWPRSPSRTTSGSTTSSRA